jgi:hypothetical protein
VNTFGFSDSREVDVAGVFAAEAAAAAGDADGDGFTKVAVAVGGNDEFAEMLESWERGVTLGAVEAPVVFVGSVAFGGGRGAPSRLSVQSRYLVEPSGDSTAPVA